MPCKVTFKDGNTIEYVYAADGTKLQTVHKIDGETTTRDYCGNAVYENGELKMLLNEYGYVSFPDRKFHFYLKDHQGNVRVVADADGNVEEINDYYPFGGLMSSTTTNEFQPYKYNGKEIDRKAGLNLYDYGARFYDPAIGRFTTNDRFAEKYYVLRKFMPFASRSFFTDKNWGNALQRSLIYRQPAETATTYNPPQIKKYNKIAYLFHKRKQIQFIFSTFAIIRTNNIKKL